MQAGYWRSACRSEIPPNCLTELVGCEPTGDEDNGELGWREVYLGWRCSTTASQLQSKSVCQPCNDPIMVLRQSGDFCITGHLSGSLEVEDKGRGG